VLVFPVHGREEVFKKISVLSGRGEVAGGPWRRRWISRLTSCRSTSDQPPDMQSVNILVQALTVRGHAISADRTSWRT